VKLHESVAEMANNVTIEMPCAVYLILTPKNLTCVVIVRHSLEVEVVVPGRGSDSRYGFY